MISRVERGQASPTAALLGRLSGAFSLTMSQLIARSEDSQRPVTRRAEQPVWVDPDSRYVRRAVSPPTGGPLELVEVELPAGGEIAFPASAYSFLRQQIWVLDGELRLITEPDTIVLQAGDCIALGTPAPLRFVNAGPAPVRYLVVVVR
jgi:transcriptional regulator with XRE-family HTH domain